MTETIDTQVERATPAEWIARFEIFRERFRLGLIDANAFKNVTRAFQFTDDLGHIWMPGATSNQWYRWDRTRWSVAAPPAQLGATAMPVAMTLAWNRGAILAPSSADAPRVQVEVPPQPSEPPRAETKPAMIEPAPAIPTPPATPLARQACPHCRQTYIAPARFCPNCGEPLTSDRKSRRPTDLPERGVTRGRPKPTDLPR